MIVYEEADLLASDCDVIVHGCNCFCTFGAGIALQIKKRFPEAFWADQRTERGDHKKLGTIQVVQCGGVEVVNLYSQYDCGGSGAGHRYADYNAIRRGMQALQVEMDQRPMAKLGMPLIGCGLAGGDWSVVSKIIEEAFEEMPVFVYRWPPR